MDVTEWAKQYRPVANNFDDNASFQDFQDESGVGVMFETYGEELDFVRSIAASDPTAVWTYVDGDDGSTVIINGYHIVNRIGYFVTEIPATDENVFVEVCGPDEEEE